MISILAGILKGVALLFIGSEARASINDSARRILNHSIDKYLPEEERSRYREEWLAELLAIESSIGRLLFAWQVSRSARAVSVVLRDPAPTEHDATTSVRNTDLPGWVVALQRLRLPRWIVKPSVQLIVLGVVITSGPRARVAKVLGKEPPSALTQLVTSVILLLCIGWLTDVICGKAAEPEPTN